MSEVHHRAPQKNDEDAVMRQMNDEENDESGCTKYWENVRQSRKVTWGQKGFLMEFKTKKIRNIYLLGDGFMGKRVFEVKFF